MPETEQPRDILCHVADLHFWQVVTNPLRLANKRLLGNLNVWLRRRREFVMTHAEPFADALAVTGVTEALLTGDFSSTALDEELALAARFVRGLARRGMRVTLLPGNHDVYTFEAARARRFERHFAEFRPEGGYPARVTLAGGTPLILVPTAVPNWLSARGRVTEKEIETVARLVAECPPGPVLVAAHYPLLYRTAGYSSTRQHRLRNARSLRECLGKSGRRILYVAGHVHRFSYVRDETYPALTHLTTGGFFCKKAGAAHDGEFSEIHVLDAGFRIFCHRHQGQWDRKEVGLS